jgi:amino acid permease
MNETAWDREAGNGDWMEMNRRTVTKENATVQVSEPEDLVPQRQSPSSGDRELMFKARHIQMMALGSLLFDVTDCRFGNGK